MFLTSRHGIFGTVITILAYTGMPLMFWWGVIPWLDPDPRLGDFFVLLAGCSLLLSASYLVLESPPLPFDGHASDLSDVEKAEYLSIIQEDDTLLRGVGMSAQSTLAMFLQFQRGKATAEDWAWKITCPLTVMALLVLTKFRGLDLLTKQLLYVGLPSIGFLGYLSIRRALILFHIVRNLPRYRF
jgi:hypothetical protein